VPYDPPLVKRLRFFSSSTHFLGPCRRALAGFGRLFGGAPRKRILPGEELKRVWIVAPDNAFGSIAKLLILTGQRVGVISKLMADMIGKTPSPYPLGSPKTADSTRFRSGQSSVYVAESSPRSQ